MKLIVTLFMAFTVGWSWSQETYNNCNNALELCPNNPVTVNNYSANKTFCPNCEDDFTFCMTPNNSIWLKFTTNELGGDIQVNFNNPLFQSQVGQDNRYNAALIQANIPCNAASYTQVGNCVTTATGNQVINALGLPANTAYYIVLSGEKSGAGITLAAEFSMTVAVSGTAIDRPVPTLYLGIEDTICANTLAFVSGSRTNCTDAGEFRWYLNNQLIATTTDSIIFTDKINNGDIITVETDCFTTCPLTITQTTLPLVVHSVIADAGIDRTIRPGESVQIGGGITVNDTLVWLPSYALSDAQVAFPIANPQETTTYQLLVTDTTTGCRASDYITITVDKGLFFPTTFSPNGDGANDTWEILGIEAYPDCFVSIFDRWGQKVFEAVGYNKEKAWNGTGKMGKLNEGVYFYKIQLHDKEKQQMTGSITLIR
ncbi:MAG TPA: gliding motility-associated C-terminal domain-containing protein [Taishania sp.]|nr:gliding motility-associated C-terminal domain-containing protein [Taishania sp.]